MYREQSATMKALVLLISVIASYCSTVASAQTAGSFDASFGRGGIVDFSFYDGFLLNAVAIQPDKKIIVGGSCSPVVTNRISAKFCIRRLNNDGTIDATFGPTEPTPGTVAFYINDYDTARGVQSISLQPDGKILVAGPCEKPPGPISQRYCFARLNANGTFDASFKGPLATANGSFDVSAYHELSVLLQPDEKIILAGDCEYTPFVRNEARCVGRRMNADGSFDSSFGVNGRLMLPFSVRPLQGSLRRITDGAGYFNVSNGAILRPNGKLVLIGTCSIPLSRQSPFCAIQFNADGSIDNGFNAQGLPPGKAISAGTLGNDYFSYSATNGLLQTDGSIVVVGYCKATQDAPEEFCAARFREDGSNDLTFSGPLRNAPGEFRFLVGTSSNIPIGAALQSDGKLVMGGGCLPGATYPDGSPIAGSGSMCLARLNVDGSFDATFDGDVGNADGRLRVSSPSHSVMNIAIQSDGKLVMVGVGVQYTPFLATVARISRLHAGTAVSARCSLDFDGSGVVSAPDVLLWARYQLGLRSASLVQGIAPIPSGVSAEVFSAAVLARIESNSLAALDFDGDGSVRALVEPLLLLRLIQSTPEGGFLSGISSSLSAPRNTRALIAAHVNTQCGTNF